MAPSRKSRSVNKRFSALNEFSVEKEAGDSNKNKPRKRKLSDKLGSQWSKEELERFYEAYRKCGKDWKKVASAVRNRSSEMVEALYNMNRAYLSLPEGTASVVGLIAMMTDHYNVLEGSDSERESNEASVSQKPQKCKRGKVQLTPPKGVSQSRAVASDEGCLSLLKKGQFDNGLPRAVGKRTPRFPVYRKVDRENYVLPNRRGKELDVDGSSDDDEHVAVLALTEGFKSLSPHVSQPSKKTENLKSSPAQSLEGTIRSTSIEDRLKESVESRGTENGEYAKDTSSLMHMEGVGTVEIHRKGKRFYRKNQEVEDGLNHQLDDGGEACSGTEEELNLNACRKKIRNEINKGKSVKFSPHSQRKGRGKLCFVDDRSNLYTLHKLADLSLKMPTSTLASELSVQLKDEKGNLESDRSGLPEATSTSQHRNKVKVTGKKEKVPQAMAVEGSRKSKLARESAHHVSSAFEAKEKLQTADKSLKRRCKSLPSKSSDTKTVSPPSEPLKNEAISEEENKSTVKSKRTSQPFTISMQSSSLRLSDSLLSTEQKELAPPTQTPVATEASLPSKRINRRKMNRQQVFLSKEMKSTDNVLKNQIHKNSTSLQSRAYSAKNFLEMLSGCLSSNLVRNWCTYEWFYGAIDYPWFAKREFMEYLNHVGLGNIPRLTRVEWSVIKSSLGKPRRFSENFLCEERHKLQQYRESVRKHYTELRTGVRDGFPTDLARPLYVGQQVIAIHPKTREIHGGSVLTVDHDRCRVQFDCPEIGVEFVMDIDCMPLNPMDNMPEDLRRENTVGKVSLMTKEPQVNECAGRSLTYASGGHLENVISSSSTLVKQGDTKNSVSQTAITLDNTGTQQATYTSVSTGTHNQAREADIRALSELTRALDKKEAWLMELRNTNNFVLENQNELESLKDSDSFKKHYATVLVQLKEASGQVSSALFHLRQRNNYREKCQPPWLKSQAYYCDQDILYSSLDSPLISQESGSSIIEIIKRSRLKANIMVDAATEAFSFLKEGEDAFTRIGQVLDSIDYQQSASNPTQIAIGSHEHTGSFAVGRSTSFSSESPLRNDASGQNQVNDSVRNVAQIPSELITSCVATLLMIQTCTERQYPPAEVAQILDSAVTSLHPWCPQNLSIYREIQMCMGRIKTQILALIPT